MEQFLIQEAEKEIKGKQAKILIDRFQQRVKLFFILKMGTKENVEPLFSCFIFECISDLQRIWKISRKKKLN